MALVEDDDVIRTLPADAANDALGIGILPRPPRCDRTFLHPQTAHALSKVISIDSIAITQQVLRRRRPWKGLTELLRRPFGGRMLRHIVSRQPGGDRERGQRARTARAIAPWER